MYGSLLLKDRRAVDKVTKILALRVSREGGYMLGVWSCDYHIRLRCIGTPTYTACACIMKGVFSMYTTLVWCGYRCRAMVSDIWQGIGI